MILKNFLRTFTLGFLLASFSLVATTRAEDNSAAVNAWDNALLSWDAVFEETEEYLDNALFDEAAAEKIYSRLSRLRSQAIGFKDAIENQREAVETLISALGDAPAEGEKPEPATLAEKRSEYNSKLAILKEYLARIDLAILRSAELSQDMSRMRRGNFVREVFYLYPSPIMPATLAVASGEMLEHIKSLVVAPVAWYSILSSEQRGRLDRGGTVLVLLGFLLLGHLLRKWVINHYGRKPGIDDPGPTLKVSAAIAEGVGNGLLPVLTIVGLALWVTQLNITPVGLFGDILRSGFKTLLLFIILSTLVNAMLSPEHPGWRLLDISPRATRVIGYSTIVLLAVVGMDLFIREVSDSLPVSEEVYSVYTTIVVIIKAVLVVVISSERWWSSNTGTHSREHSAVEPATAYVIVSYIRKLSILLMVFAVLATLVGYTGVAAYLANNLIASAIVVFLLAGVRAVLLELIATLTHSRLMRDSTGLKLPALRRIRIWSSGLLSLVFFFLGLGTLALLWGVAKEDLARWINYIFTGFSVGSIYISLTDILLALLVFSGVMLITRLVQRSLLNSVLPQFTSNRSLQYSLSSGTGYIGIVIALMMFVAALGIKLESIALVAGALSVGIGFGLQNVVNNFVSGLILILERPIKVGDWVSVGGNEGFVQRINFRATELETFTRATVIIPNAEMLSTSVLNMTYHDKTSRVEIPLQVKYGTDPEKVIDILMTCAREHTQVLNYPEAQVLLQSFAADGLDFELRCYVRDATLKLSVASDIRLRVLGRLNEENIEIPFPQRVVYLQSGIDAIPGKND